MPVTVTANESTSFSSYSLNAANKGTINASYSDHEFAEPVEFSVYFLSFLSAFLAVSIRTSLCVSKVRGFLQFLLFSLCISLKIYNVRVLSLPLSFCVSLRPTMTQWRVKVPSLASPHPT